MNTIKIYGKTNCPWCDRAKSLVSRYGFQYEYFDIGRKQYYDELKESVPDLKTVPQIFWNERYIGGYNELANEIENTVGSYGDQLF
jgi:glutaredoxin